MKRKVALITGISGQDGRYLAALLLSKGYEVHGLTRHKASFAPITIDDGWDTTSNGSKIDYDLTQLQLHHGDLTDASNLMRLVKDCAPDEIYNLGAQSHVAVSFELPEYTLNCNALGPMRLLEAIRTLELGKRTRFYQASTSEMFGNTPTVPQSESTPFCPRSPYAISKLNAHWITVNYREAYGLYAASGILFNHESPKRGENFVSRKISLAFSHMAFGLQDCLSLGNLDAKRDWGHARDYVEAQWLILQQEQAEDFVIATGVQHSVRDFVNGAAAELELELEWCGIGADEIALVKSSTKFKGFQKGQVVVRVDPQFFRPTEVSNLMGDASKAKLKLGWTPRTSFAQLVKEMVAADLALAKSTS